LGGLVDVIFRFVAHDRRSSHHDVLEKKSYARVQSDVLISTLTVLLAIKP
jgi:hypothetical protein